MYRRGAPENRRAQRSDQPFRSACSGNSYSLGQWRRGSTLGNISDFKEEIPIGSLVTELTLEDITKLEVSAAVAKISDVEEVASYSITTSAPPRIVVPGKSSHLRFFVAYLWLVMI